MPKPLTTDDLIRMGCQWGYKVIAAPKTAEDEEAINKLGADCWEMVAATNGLIYFKRRLPWQSGDTGAAS